jgi:hypothetical protein
MLILDSKMSDNEKLQPNPIGLGCQLMMINFLYDTLRIS